jgi:hypothetical protein
MTTAGCSWPGPGPGLLDATGFVLERAIALPSRFSILECRPRQED